MRYLVKRTARAILTLWVGLSVAFFIIRFMPGNPLDGKRSEIALDNPTLSPAQVEERLIDYANSIGINYDAPVHEQYFNYWAGLLQGDLGVSSEVSGRQVTAIIGEALPWTLLVVVIATVLVFAIAIIAGAIIAYREGTWLDTITSSLSILLTAIPFYVMAFILIITVGYGTGWFPTQGTTGRSIELSAGIHFFISALHHAMLPILAMVITQTGTWLLSMRGNSIQVLGEDYVRVARLRGLSDRRISTRYVARNALLPLYTGFLMMIGYNIGSSIILEEIFRYQGIGWYMLEGLNSNDYNLVMGTFTVYAAALVLAVFIADLTYSYIDPRVKTGGASEAY